jgi:hypothetical protein
MRISSRGRGSLLDVADGVLSLCVRAYQYQHLPLDGLRWRWRDAEQQAFDVVWNCDTIVEPDRPRHMMFDGPTTLAMMAAETSRIRVGTLVSSLYFREPVTVAKAAMTLDHLSGGRVEVGARGWRPLRGICRSRSHSIAHRAGCPLRRVRRSRRSAPAPGGDHLHRHLLPVRQRRDDPATVAAAAAARHDRGSRTKDAAYCGPLRRRLEFLGRLRRADRARLLHGDRTTLRPLRRTRRRTRPR